MANFPTWILVVALALFDAEGRVLLQQRLAHKHHGGLWEFPGGKVENGENPPFALCREIAEELGLTLDPAQMEPAFFAEENGSPAIVLNLYTSRQFVSEPCANDGQAWGWFALDEAAELPLAPMDRELLAKLRG
ncbi:(deoxy)nucleoside triphosphate pyrophosphohydrolase [Aurantiacibacter poecillastricola]|uniref:(deoxy)nucleoside triphosphate pyrophosphohydrolase n=1 Tax=Aurantiacibacter poecillastricola TaxID=3064385 RepID=UPI00273FEB4B|nr:(deoxy)nucleoside triphosphate pyrophosphohydrolase [Aurantiacibacter sp. 219JJ12-13]MDP5262218.1 (deoxy)nucleoside triphosphate pyrophosphohydrolase [Aurantiacibacter sp. 219JJ12-13]